MKINIDQKPIAKATLNLWGFKTDLAKNFDLKSALYNNTDVTYSSGSDTDIIKSLMFHGTDWGAFLQFMHDYVNSGKIEFKLYSCDVRGYTTYVPEDIDANAGTVNLYSTTDDSKNILVTNSLSPRIDRNIEIMLSQKLIDYMNHEWKVTIAR